MTTEADAVASIMVGGGRSSASGDGEAVDAAVDALAALVGRIGRDGVGIHIARVFSTVLAAMWEGGWQPAEVARAVRRAQGSRHADLVAVAIAAEPAAAEGRRGAAPARWASQLEALDAARWWGPSDNWLEPWATREGVYWLVALEMAIEALGVLLPLPPLESLIPPPSKWDQRAWIPPSPGGADDSVLAKVRALLAKAESTSFEAEAEALTAKAQELMSRHSIDDLLARSAPGRTGTRPSARRIPVDDPYADAKSSLLLAVGRANGARCVWHSRFGFMTVIALPGDLDAVETLFTSLLVQATRSLVASRPDSDPRGRSRTRSYRHSFLLSFAVRIGERLAEAAEYTRRAAETELSVDLLPVLADREREVDEMVDEMFPNVTRKRPGSASNIEGWRAGRSAADRARLDAGHAPLSRAAGG